MTNHDRDVELIDLYWTTSGPVEIATGREWSLFDIADRAAEAAKVGFSGIGIWHADLEHILETRSLHEVKQILDDHGLTQLELEFLMDWFLDEGDERRATADRIRKMVLEAASVLEPHHIKVGNIPGIPCPLPKVTEKFAELCADAANYTTAKIAYEFMPFDPNVSGVEAAVQLAEGAGAPNGGIALDTWHLGTFGTGPEALRQVPGHLLAWVELSDGWPRPGASLDELRDDTINRRQLPGEGEFDIRGYVAVCQEIGYDGPWGVEVISEALRSLPIEEMFRRAYETTSSQFR